MATHWFNFANILLSNYCKTLTLRTCPTFTVSKTQMWPTSFYLHLPQRVKEILQIQNWLNHPTESGTGRSVNAATNFIKLFSSALTVLKNMVECLSLASLFALVLSLNQKCNMCKKTWMKALSRKNTLPYFTLVRSFHPSLFTHGTLLV